GGIAARLLGLPGAPAVELTVQGEGPISDYTAEVRLASDGAERLAGSVTLQAPAEGGRAFRADLGGDLAPLFLPDYAAFFGPDVRLQTAGVRTTDGRLNLSQLALRTRALTLEGSLALAVDGLPERFDLRGTLGLNGAPVLLPLATDQRTSVRGADLSLRFDAAEDDGWRGAVSMTGLERADFRADQMRITGSGRITRAPGGSAGSVIGATLDFAAQGLAPADAALARALGESIDGAATLYWQAGSDAVQLPQFALNGEGYGLTAGGRIDGLASGITVTGHASARLDDLTRLALLAGRPLAGSGTAEVQGNSSLLGGGFDLEASLAGTDLRFGQAELDNLLRGSSVIGVSARRDETGTQLRRLDITASTLRLTGSGTLATAGSELNAVLAFSDLSALGGAYGGALTGEAQFSGTPANGRLVLDAVGDRLAIGQAEADRLLRGQSTISAVLDLAEGQIRIDRASLENPQLSVEATGTLGGAGAGETRQVDLSARLADLGLLLPEFPGPVTLSGTAVEDAQGYVLDLQGRGPGQIDAAVAGRLAPGFDRADLTIAGSAQAGLANAFIAPRVVSGPLRFDLALNGPLAPASLSGRIALSGGRIADPGLPFALEGVAANADLAGGRMRLGVEAGVSTGGRLRVSGGMALAAPFDADLTAGLQQVVLKNPLLYETRLNGSVTVAGPLAGGARIGGAILLNETELRIPSTGLGGAGVLPDLRHVNEPAEVRATRARAGLIETAAAGGGAGGGRPYPLDLTISAPNRMFIRGRGLDAELGGTLRLGGTTANVVPSGAFDLIRGRLDILGRRLDLTHALLRLEGDFVPFVQIMASNESDGITSSVLIEGQATEPTVRFVSSPELPEEEVLAHLLFGRGLTSLSALQAAQLAGAVATLAGKGGGGIVGKLRSGFGLDDLDLVTDENGGASVTAGKYLSKNLYTEIVVGQEGESQINLNLDLTPTITLRGSTGTEGTTGIGVFIEKDY
ncbi:MAG TPA: translocation/assembly module TamB domain-containing protein, partial [Paracoccaceae bacterium]